MLEGDECLFWEKNHPMDGGRLCIIMQKQGYTHSKKSWMDSKKEVYIANFYGIFDPFHCEWP